MKLAILDKDGTLVLPKSGNTFVQNPTDQILMVGAVEGCQRLIDAGYVLAIASNQGGIASGYKTLDEAISEMQYCLHLLSEFNIKIAQKAYFCPDFEGQKCYWANLNDGGDCGASSIFFGGAGGFRKPSAGMLHLSACDVPVGEEFTDCWMIGDREEDRLAAEAAGFSFLDADEWRKGASPWII